MQMFRVSERDACAINLHYKNDRHVKHITLESPEIVKTILRIFRAFSSDMGIEFNFLLQPLSWARQASQLETLFEIAGTKCSRQRKYVTHPPNP